MLRNILLTFLLYSNVKSQSNKDLYNGQFNNDYYNVRQQDSSRESRLPNPGDSNYRTYMYNDRRYGTNPNRYNPYNPNINRPGGFPYNPIDTNPLDDQFKYNTVSFFFCKMLMFITTLLHTPENLIKFI